MSKPFAKHLLCLAVLASAAANVVAGPLVTYFGENQIANGSVTGAPVTKRQEWVDAVQNILTQNFESVTLGLIPSAGTSLSFSSVTSTIKAEAGGGSDATAVVDTPFASSNGRFNTTASGSRYLETDWNFYIDFGLNPISAFGFYATDVGDQGAGLQVQLTDSATGQPLSPITVRAPSTGTDAALLFWGFVDSSKKYSRITFINSLSQNPADEDRDVFGFDDLMIATPKSGGGGNDIPEPASVLLLGLGLLALRATRRR